MGLLSAAQFGVLPALLNQQEQQPQLQPPQMPPQGAGMMGAFQNSPQFAQQLGAMMNGQGPGRQAPTFTPPPMQMSTSAQGAGGGGQMPFRGYGQAGGQIDPLAFLRNQQF